MRFVLSPYLNNYVYRHTRRTAYKVLHTGHLKNDKALNSVSITNFKKLRVYYVFKVTIQKKAVPST